MSERHDRIAEMFARTRREGRTAVIPFVPGGWPESDATPGIVTAAAHSGADAVEIGFPFSDPLADGVTNQRAYQQAIEGGFTIPRLLDAVRCVRADGVRIPLLVMGYFNPLLAYGVSEFVQDAADAGIDGLILVDLPPEEAAEIEQPARAAGLQHLVYLLAPTSTDEANRAGRRTRQRVHLLRERDRRDGSAQLARRRATRLPEAGAGEDGAPAGRRVRHLGA